MPDDARIVEHASLLPPPEVRRRKCVATPMLRKSAIDLIRLIAGTSLLEVNASLLIGFGVFGIFAGRTGPVEIMFGGYLALIAGIALGSWARNDLHLGPLWIAVLTRLPSDEKTLPRSPIAGGTRISRPGWRVNVPVMELAVWDAIWY